jgi:hypothetical protein
MEAGGVGAAAAAATASLFAAGLGTAPPLRVWAI